MAHRMVVNVLASGSVEQVQDVVGYAGNDVLERAVAYMEDVYRTTGERMVLVVAGAEDELPSYEALDALLDS